MKTYLGDGNALSRLATAELREVENSTKQWGSPSITIDRGGDETHAWLLMARIDATSKSAHIVRYHILNDDEGKTIGHYDQRHSTFLDRDDLLAILSLMEGRDHA